jgi:hypothetical protein
MADKKKNWNQIIREMNPPPEPHLAEDLNKLAKIPVGRMVEIPAEIKVIQKIDKINTDMDKMIQQIITVNAYVTKLEQDNKSMLQALKVLQLFTDLCFDDIKRCGNISSNHAKDFRHARKNALDTIKQAEETPIN